MKEIKGDLLALAKKGEFDLIMHGCNCFNTMGAGIALQVSKQFPLAYDVDLTTVKGDIMKLGNFTSASFPVENNNEGKVFTIINAYTQYDFNSKNKPFDYEALALVCKKLNLKYSGLSIGVPQIGAGLAGGDWKEIKEILMDELTSLDLTIVYYE